MKTLFLLPLLLVVSLAGAQSSSIQFIDGWIKQLPPVIPMRAGYVRIKNTGDAAKNISSLSSTAFEKVQMHETKMVDGVMKMIELEQLQIPPQAEVEFKPGGKHMMLIDPVQPLQIGDMVDITANFTDGSHQSFPLEVKK